MKRVSILTLSALAAIGVLPLSAHATPVSYTNAPGIIVNNIANMQHSIVLSAFNNFGDAMDLREYAPTKTPVPKQKKVNQHSPFVYGEMPQYGEYGDDGTVFQSGHSGGDFGISNYNWFNWQHAQDKAVFKDVDAIDSKYDLISMGFSNGPKQIKDGYSQFGVFGSLTMAHENSDVVNISENGGLVGIFQGFNVNNFNVMLAADFGMLFSDATSTLANYDYTNIWVGASLGASYDIVMDDSFVLQPGVYAGYTWIHSGGYDSDTGVNASIDSSKMFEASPSLRAVLDLGNGWNGSVSGRYVFNFSDVGTAKIAGTTTAGIDLKNYAEYGLSIEKNAERFGFSLSLNRHDGGRTGWIGGMQIRYVF